MEEAQFYFISTPQSSLFSLSSHNSSKRETKIFPPSPTSYLIIGHLHILKDLASSHIITKSFLQIWSNLHLKFGSRPVRVISSPQFLKECFTINDINFTNRPHRLLGKHLGYNYSTMGLVHYGKLWRSIRRVTTLEFFFMNRLNTYLSICQEEIQSLLKDLSQDLILTLTKEFSIEMKWLLELFFNIIMRMAIGK